MPATPQPRMAPGFARVLVHLFFFLRGFCSMVLRFSSCDNAAMVSSVVCPVSSTCPGVAAALATAVLLLAD